jgi:hypothetical protein
LTPYGSVLKKKGATVKPQRKRAGPANAPRFWTFLVTDYDPPFSWDHIIPPKKSSTKDRLWEVRRGPDVWTCELVLDDYGSEARISKNGDLLVTRRFNLGWQILAWAEQERQDIEKGGE